MVYIKWLAGFCLAVSLILIGIPLVVVQVQAPTDQGLNSNRGTASAPILPINMYLPDENKVVQIPMEEYIKGVVAAEMPASFAEEALKAQAIAARTYLVAHLPAFGGRGCDTANFISSENGLDLSGQVIDVCADPKHGQAWLSVAQLRQRWGIFEFMRHWSKISRAVDETRGIIITYNNEPIDAVYHSASGGITEAAAEVWGNDVPYLQMKSSKLEAGNRYWENEVSYPLTEIATKLSVPYSEIQQNIRSGIPPAEIIKKSPSGRAVEIRVGEQKITASEFREKLQINSTWLAIKQLGRQLVITSKGYGHGVGMPQYGADAMARHGYKAEEIIRYYYNDTTLQQIFIE